MSKNGTIFLTCARCGHWKLHHARHLCKCCYNHASERGLLALYPTSGGFGGAGTSADASLGRPGAHPFMQGGVAA